MRVFAACSLLCVSIARTSAAQQGSVQVTAAAQSIQGDPRRTVGQAPLEPDLGVSWLRPGTRFGLLQMELRGTRRGDLPHVGKAFFSLRDFKLRGANWSIDAGDTFFSPAIGDYRFANLSTPSITFAGSSVSARTTRAAAGMIVGRATATRNLFGTDPDTVDQGLAIARASYKATDRVELFTRASHVRTGALDQYNSPIAVSDQGGFAARWIATPWVHVIADGSVVSYRRRGGESREVDGSGLAGASLLLARGWIQVNAARFSPGELPILSQPLNDRQTLFAAGELDAFARLRVFGGWESFRSNLHPEDSSAARPSVASDGSRGFAGARTPIGSRSSVALRFEAGDRRSRIVDRSLPSLSDTGTLTAEWQTNAGAVSGVARYARRQNVESQSQSTSYTIDDSSTHLFVTLSQRTQLFGTAVATRTAARDGGGSTFWQIGGGGQTQLLDRSLWLRGEGTVSRNVDILSTLAVPQQSLNVGLNGEIARNVILGLNVNADRLVTPNATGASWVSRSTLRITRSFQTAAARTPTSIASMARHSGTGSIAGVVFSDWNANGRQEPGEAFLENIPIRLSELGSSTTSKSGDFGFINVPIGLQQVGIDLSALPVDFDPPAIPHVQLQLGRNETKRVAFGLVPLNTVSGTVILDANGNGTVDPGETPMDGAVVVLDAGARSEQVRKGRFKFDAVRSGDHTIELVIDSLPAGASPAGETQISIALTQAQPTADVQFLVTRQPRPETRRVFAPPPSAPRSAPPPTAATNRPAAAAPASPPSRKADARPAANAISRAAVPAPARSEGEGFAVQIIALNDPSRARDAVAELKAAGLPAYLVEPPASDPDGPYRVRLGRYATRADAEAAATALEKSRGEKYWVIKER
ncbi:MAG TPA: SPOR domain-containing protein [Vicinamibacterales bacterium]|jgi:cell division septation protein DedD